MRYLTALLFFCSTLIANDKGQPNLVDIHGLDLHKYSAIQLVADSVPLQADNPLDLPSVLTGCECEAELSILMTYDGPNPVDEVTVDTGSVANTSDSYTVRNSNINLELELDDGSRGQCIVPPGGNNCSQPDGMGDCSLSATLVITLHNSNQFYLSPDPNDPNGPWTSTSGPAVITLSYYFADLNCGDGVPFTGQSQDFSIGDFSDIKSFARAYIFGFCSPCPAEIDD